MNRMFKTTGPTSVYIIACLTKTGAWFEERIEACSREHAKQIAIGRFAPVRLWFAKEAA